MAFNKKEEMLKPLKTDIPNGYSVKLYYVSLPAQEAHNKTHMTGSMHAMA